MQILSRNRTKIWFVAVVAAIFIYLFFTHSKEAVLEPAVSSYVPEKVMLSTSTIPVAVSGVVVATDRAVVAAEIGGVVESVFVQEGSYVNTGSLLVSQKSPVAAATYALRQAEAGLTQIQQSANVDARESALAQSEVVAYSAEEIAALSGVAMDNRVGDARNTLLVAAEGNVTTILDALQFINENKSLFNADTFPVFERVVADLYGSIPKHFQGSVTRSVRSESDLLELIGLYRTTEDLSVVDVKNLYALLEAENAALLEMYSEGEADVLDRSRIEPSSTEYQEYFSKRAAVIEARRDLVAAAASFSQAVDQSATTAVNQDQSVAVSVLDEEAAARQARFSEAISAAAQNVAMAARNVTAAELSLKDVRAPFAGVVARRFVEVGEYAAPGAPLIELQGVGGIEVRVSVPLVFAHELEIGQSFSVSGEIVGVVDRFSPVSSGNVVSVVVSLFSDTFPVGSTVSGELALTGAESVFMIPRSYVHFGNEGAYVMDESGETYQIVIVYDNGADLYVTTKGDVPTKSLRPAYSIALKK